MVLAPLAPEVLDVSNFEKTCHESQRIFFHTHLYLNSADHQDRDTGNNKMEQRSQELD